MAMDLLRLLAACPLPAICRTAKEVDEVRPLRAAGLVVALTPHLGARSHDGDRAVVLSITPKGFEELQAFECRRFPFLAPQNGAPLPVDAVSSSNAITAA